VTFLMLYPVIVLSVFGLFVLWCWRNGFLDD